MNKNAIAKEKFSASCNCAQSVLVALAGDVANDNTLQLMASAFGGGIAQTGNTCGAVTGALMALGIKNGYTQAGSAEDKAELYRMANDFLRSFQEKNGSCNCKDLIKYDISVAGEKEKARNAGVFTNLCPVFVVSAVEIMDDILHYHK
ncbi:C-GCAxxG-C-C family protein [Plebeiibacterium marinum]|uniref:C-GCAxxG-C-C family protein n=1 Tax=Plebeiibacterium marinum TaxID=2992111 RepID=A0AAE3MBT2_9BACT|nr:C-GCAxxG-C-C family protein [Plebeiobacterium marinum]MCW3804861.1 C-GCAxxG-C-C family protein [Plebeiobacterium marinum]